MSKINLYKETLEAVENSGHKTADVGFVFFLSSGGYRQTTWADFASVALGIEYDNESTCYGISSDLRVVFKDNSWLERETDGHGEWWNFQTAPKEQVAGKISGEDICGSVEVEK